MTRRRSASETARHAKAKRSTALMRVELRQPSTPRVAAAGVTSMAVKEQDTATRKMIDDAIARRDLAQI